MFICPQFFPTIFSNNNRQLFYIGVDFCSGAADQPDCFRYFKTHGLGTYHVCLAPAQCGGVVIQVHWRQAIASACDGAPRQTLRGGWRTESVTLKYLGAELSQP